MASAGEPPDTGKDIGSAAAASSNLASRTEGEVCQRLTLKRETVVTYSFSSSTHLTEIDISNCDLTCLPRPLELLVNLKKINFSKNRLTRISKVLESCANLEEVDASDNDITTLQQNIAWINYSDSCGSLPKDSSDSIYGTDELTEDANANRAEQSLEQEIDFGQLRNLQVLNLHRNSLRQIPLSISNHPSITHLNLSHNKLRILPSTFASAATLKHLYLDGNGFEELYALPGWLFLLKRCTILSLAGSYLADLADDIPVELGQSSQRLLKLDLRHTSLTRFPEGLCGLLDLEILLIGNSPQCTNTRKLRNSVATSLTLAKNKNIFWNLPPSLGNLVGLEQLDVSNVNLVSLPDNVGSLVSLKHLNLSGNDLSWLPGSLVNLHQLERLDVSHNNLQNLPMGIASMTSLKHLIVDHNQLYELPNELCGMKSLETLDAYSNMLSTFLQNFHESDLSRVDIAGNKIDKKNIRETLGQATLDKYEAAQSSLRCWEEFQDGDPRLPLADCLESLDGHEEDTVTDQEEEEEHVSCTNFELSDDDKRETELNETMESEDWTEVGEPYQNSFFSNSKPCNPDNLERLFCPADDHPDPINVSLVKKWEEQLSYRGSSRIGVSARLGTGTHFSSLVVAPNQFEDCEDDDWTEPENN